MYVASLHYLPDLMQIKTLALNEMKRGSEGVLLCFYRTSFFLLVANNEYIFCIPVIGNLIYNDEEGLKKIRINFH